MTRLHFPPAQKLETHDGISTRYYVWEPSDPTPAQPTLILHHGYMSSAKQTWFDPGTIDILQALGCRIIAVDARGHGQSDKPHDTKFYGEENMACDVMALADKLELDQYDFCGFSMGGMVASRLGTMEKRLRRLIITGVGEGILKFGGPDKSVLNMEELAEGLLAEDGSSYSERIQNWRKIIKENGCDLHAMVAQARCFGQSAIPVEKIVVPTLVIVGDRDDLAPHADRLTAAISGARLVVVPGDHGESVEAVEYAAAVIEFLR